MRLLVTGGRHFTERDLLREAIKALNPSVIIHGGARGADTFAGEWAREHGRQEIAEPVTDQEWDMLGGMAGHVRNERMFKYKPDLVLAAPGGTGTADCIDRALKRRLPVLKLVQP